MMHTPAEPLRPLRSLPFPRTSADPAFVLCGARSGSTLLRFMLDAHPELACPAETDLPALCAHMTSVWSILGGRPIAANADDTPVPEPVLVRLRQAIEPMVRSYLDQRGKARYCDKSLGTARHAGLLTQVFPDAKFICLYRHPMDMIASGIEACPWGLKGYGFEPYAADSPHNAVLALARYWADQAAAILAVEDRFPGRCHRVRYEDLVADPEPVIGEVFRFLEVPQAPGTSAACFAPERERLGPADYKIWHTSRITSDSVGRGWSIPAGLIGAAATAKINELAERLEYVRVDERWSTADAPPDLRRPSADLLAVSPVPDGGDTTAMPRACLLIADLLQSGLYRVSDRFISRWGPHAAESFTVVATSPSVPAGTAKWRVDLKARTLTLARAGRAEDGADDTAWQIIGAAETWERVIRGNLNLNVALRRRDLLYCDTGDGGPATVTRISMFADLLGITSWRSAVPQPQAATVA
jgi:hypothetical protein